MGNLFETFEYTGEWWIPSKPDVRFPGTVSVEPGRYITLRFHDFDATFAEFVPIMGNPEYQTFGRDTEQPIILGLTDTGRHVVLLECVGRRFFSLHYEATRLLLSNNELLYPTPDSIQLSSLSASYTYLEEWLPNFPFQYKLRHDKEKKTVEFKAKYQTPDTIIAPIDSIDAETHFRFYPGWSSDGIKSFTWTQSAAVQIIPSTPRSIDWFLETSQYLEKLLTILIGERVRTLTLKARRGEDDDDDLRQDIDIYYTVDPEQPRKQLDADWMVMSARHLGENWGAILETWFEKQAFIKPLLKLFLGTIYGWHSLPEFQFLSLTQALESYHRKRYGGEYLSEEGYKPHLETLKQAIPSELPKRMRDHLKSALQYGYQFSQRTRFKDLLSTVDTNLTQLVRIDKEYLNIIVDSRNYYTHYDEKTRPKNLLRGTDLYRANGRLASFIVILILWELNIPNDKIEEAIQRFKDSRGFR